MCLEMQSQSRHRREQKEYCITHFDVLTMVLALSDPKLYWAVGEAP